MRAGEERTQAVSPDPLQPLSQDQRQARRGQQHPRPWNQVLFRVVRRAENVFNVLHTLSV